MRSRSGSSRALLFTLVFVAIWFGIKLVLFGTKQENKDELHPRVQDRAEIFLPEQAENMALHHKLLLEDFDLDYVVLTAHGTGDINRFSLQHFEDLQVGSDSTTGRGLLLLIDPTQNQVRLEVSQALEGVFVDAFIAYIEQRQMVPFFQEYRIADGILATTELIVTRARNALNNDGFENEAWAPFAAGAGATTSAEIGTGYAAPVAETSSTLASDSPADTLSAYLKVMSQRNANPDLEIYTPATREMLANWVVTPAQMDNVVRSYRECKPATTRFGPDGRLAVIRYPVSQRLCSPWFLSKSGSKWQLDLTMMQRAIRFGRNNQWRFAQPEQHEYGFAFEDWRRDRNGFPHPR